MTAIDAPHIRDHDTARATPVVFQVNGDDRGHTSIVASVIQNVPCANRHKESNMKRHSVAKAILKDERVLRRETTIEAG